MDVRKSINTVKTMTLGNRLGTGTLRRLIGASVAAGSGLLILSAPVLAATDVRASGTPGRVIANPPEATCQAMFNPFALFASSNDSIVSTKVHPPSVTAAQLSNGSAGQYVHYKAVFYDTTTGQGVGTNWSPWQWATVAGAAQWSGAWASPVLSIAYDSTKTVGHEFVVQFRIEWWDPISAQYSAVVWYTVNEYLYSYAGVAYTRPTCVLGTP